METTEAPVAHVTLGRFAALLALLLFVSFPDVLSGSRSFFTRDFLSFGYPLAYHVQQSYRAGEVPLWNPYNFAGHPFLAQWNTLCLYPLSLIYIALPLPWSLNIFNLGHLYLGGLGMFLLARRWLRDGRAASLSGIAYAFGGMMLSALMWPNNIAALGWMPLALLTGERAATAGGKECLKSAAILLLQFLAGAPEVIALTWCAVAALAVGAPENDLIPLWTRCRRLTALFGLTALLGAVQFLPFLELLQRSHRHGLSSAVVWALPWSGLGNFLVPLFRTIKDRDGIYFQFEQQWTTSYYAGATVLWLALLGLWFDRGRRTRFLALGCLIAAGIALGSKARLFDWLRDWVPPVRLMRYPVKFIVVIAVFLPLLAGFGARAWFQGRVSKRAAAISLGLMFAGSLACMALARWRPVAGENVIQTCQSGFVSLLFVGLLWAAFAFASRPNASPSNLLISCMLGVVVFADLGIANRHINPTAQAALLKGKTSRIDPAPQLGQDRVLVSRAAQTTLDAVIFPTPQEAVLVPRLALALDINLLEAIPKLDGFFSLYLLKPTTVVDRLPADPKSQPPALLDFLGVSHQSDPARPWLWDARPGALPLASLVPRAIFLEGTNALARVFSGAFDPRSYVILPSTARAQIKADGQGRGQILASQSTSRRVHVSTQSDQPMFLVLAQAYYPGWRAILDGQPVPLWEANYAFQALEVPEGRHEIAVVFDSTSFRFGAVISALAALCSGLYLARLTRPAAGKGACNWGAIF